MGLYTVFDTSQQYIVCSETIHLSTSHEGRAACIGERIVFMCTVTGLGILQCIVNQSSEWQPNQGFILGGGGEHLPSLTTILPSHRQ